MTDTAALLAQARAALADYDAAHSAAIDAARRRREAVAALVAADMSIPDIAAALGVSRPRVYQIIGGG